MKKMLMLFFGLMIIGNCFASDFNAFNESASIIGLEGSTVESFDNFEFFKTVGNKVFAVFDYQGEIDQSVLFSCINNQEQDWRQVMCIDNKLLSSRIVKTFDLPDCEPFYIAEESFSNEPYCMTCNPPIVLSDWGYLMTMNNGQIIESRELKTFVGADCSALSVSQIRLGTASAQGVYWDYGEELFFIGALVLFGVIVFFFLRRR